jgi:hypothetical protein
MFYELFFQSEFEEAGIHFLKYTEHDFKSIEGKSPSYRSLPEHGHCRTG